MMPFDWAELVLQCLLDPRQACLVSWGMDTAPLMLIVDRKVPNVQQCRCTKAPSILASPLPHVCLAAYKFQHGPVWLHDYPYVNDGGIAGMKPMQLKISTCLVPIMHTCFRVSTSSKQLPVIMLTAALLPSHRCAQRGLWCPKCYAVLPC